MLDRLNPVLKVVCLALALVVLYQTVRFVTRKEGRISLSFNLTRSALAASEKAAPPAPETNAAPAKKTGKKGADLPPLIQARVDRITQSEILGPVVRPLPMALLGIAGKDAFLRTPDGQTGLLREGDELGGVKLLSLGTNRILIEHEGQRKELTLFSGMGGESLLPKETPSRP